MNRVIALCFLLLAAVFGYFRIDSQPAWAPFAVVDVNREGEQELSPKNVVQHTQTAYKTNSSAIADSWLPDTGAPSVHAASLIALKDGAVRAFWFAGSREGAADVAIYTAVFDSKSANWSAPTVVADRVGVEKGLLRYIAKLGNPVPARMSDGRLQLFFVTVSIGGWAGSSITSMISDDEGLTWSSPQRLITSPFLNLSTLVKTPVVPFADGRLGLPAYHEWVGRFGEFLRIDAAKVIDKRRMSSGRSAIQPLVLISNTQDATAYFRQTRAANLPKQIPVSQTTNAGQVWQQANDLPISNPNAAVAGIQLNNGVRLLALNNIETGRYRLVLMMSDSQLTNWQTIAVLEDDSALPDSERHEFSYPYLISVDGDDAHLVYTWDRKKIRHRYFSAAWLKNAYTQLPNAESDASSQEVKP